MQPTLSIIVPVYNVVDLIDATLQGVLTQDFADFELILVDDGSTDGTRDLLEGYCRRDARIRLISQKNAGPAVARNTGIAAAAGRYILFLDSDDTLVEGALSQIAQKLNEHPCDMLIFGFRIINVSGGTNFLYTYPDTYLAGKADLSAHFGPLYQSNLLNQVWNKAYRAEFLQKSGCRFADYRYGEDRLFVFDLLPRCETIHISDLCLYNYFIRSKESLVSKFYDKKFEVCNLFDRSIRAFIDDYAITDSDSLQEINYMYLKSILSCETNLFLPSCPYSRKEKKATLKAILTNDQVRAAVARYLPRGFVMNTVVRIFRTESVFWNRWMAWAISFISRHFSTAFIKAKHPEAKAVKA
ncbi:MAG: glycosyltransferase family 2 protein [Ruminococcaceae bacterium]|nr:glycosyltransferase family 2 protein [Oscillospiraceae bacterium]